MLLPPLLIIIIIIITIITSAMQRINGASLKEHWAAQQNQAYKQQYQRLKPDTGMKHKVGFFAQYSHDTVILLLWSIITSCSSAHTCTCSTVIITGLYMGLIIIMQLLHVIG